MDLSQTPQPLCVLVVDDCQDTTASLTMLLEVWGHRVWAANDGEEALRLAAVHRPSVVLLDIAMPHMDGFELAQKLRHLPGLGSAFLVALTGYGDRDARCRSSQAGCNLHLLKPVEPQHIQRLLALYQDDLLNNPQPASSGGGC